MKVQLRKTKEELDNTKNKLTDLESKYKEFEIETQEKQEKFRWRLIFKDIKMEKRLAEKTAEIIEKDKLIKQLKDKIRDILKHQKDEGKSDSIQNIVITAAAALGGILSVFIVFPIDTKNNDKFGVDVASLCYRSGFSSTTSLICEH